MSDTLSITLRAIDKKFLLQNPTAENRFNAVKEKTKLIDAERRQNSYLEQILVNPEQLRADFIALRRKKYKGIIGKTLPTFYDESYNADVLKIVQLVENSEYLLTRPLREQYALMTVGATSIANGLAFTGIDYLKKQVKAPLNIDTGEVLFYITLTGLAIGGAVQMSSTNRNSHQMRPLNAIAFVQTNLEMYNATASKLRSASFDEAQTDSAIIKWQYYDRPEIKVLQPHSDVHPNVCKPNFTENKGTGIYVTVQQTKESMDQAKAWLETTKLSAKNYFLKTSEEK